MEPLLWADKARPPDLIDATIDGYKIERASRVFSVEDATKKCTWDDLHEEHDRGWRHIDDTTGETLDPKRVAKAREEEIDMFKEMKVYVYVTREQAPSDPEGKLHGARWVDVMKSSGVRSRLVAQESASSGEGDDLFAGTPPLAATKYVLNDLASRGKNGPGDVRIMILDITRAILYGKIEDKLYIELPGEEPMKTLGYVGKLEEAM